MSPTRAAVLPAPPLPLRPAPAAEPPPQAGHHHPRRPLALLKAVALAVAGIALLCASACAGPAASAAGNAALNTAIAAGAAGISRAQGGCYANCPPGTRCIEDTGLCERIPCGGACGPSERCELSGLLERCVSAAVVDLRIERSSLEPAPLPAATPVERMTPR